MAFRVGQKVVRIRKRTSFPISQDEGLEWPPCIQMGGVYTVRDVDTRAASFGWPVGLRFEEYHAKFYDCSDIGLGMWEPVFPADCFRPVATRETSIEFAHEILRKVSGRVEA